MEAESLLIDIIKEQVRVFLLDAGEFYPFGSAIDNKGVVTPIAAYVESENDNPSSQQLINLLEKSFTKDVDNGRYKLAVIAVDTVLRENGIAFNAVQLRFFEQHNSYYKTLKYSLKDSDVEFAY